MRVASLPIAVLSFFVLLPVSAAAPPTDAHGDPLPERAVARLGTVRLRASAAESAVFSPDGKSIAAGYSDFTIRVWDTATGREVRRITGFQSNDVRCVGFSPDGKRLFSNDSVNHLRAWDLATGKELWQNSTTSVFRRGPVFSPDGKEMALVLRGGRAVYRWDPDTGKLVRRLIDTGVEFVDFAYSPDGKEVVTADSQEGIRVWDRGGAFQRAMGKGRTSARLALAPDGKTVAVADKDEKTILLWDLTASKELHRLKGHDDQLVSLAFSPDGKRLLSGSNDRTARLWDVATGKEVRSFRRPEPQAYNWVVCAWSPDGKIFALTGWDGALHLYAADTYKELLDFGGHHGCICGLALSPDGKRAVTASHDFTVRLWDAATGKELGILGESSQYLHDVAWSPDGRTVALAAHTQVRLWDMRTGKERPALRAEGHSPMRVAFSPTGDVLASGDGTVCLWNAKSGKLLRRLEEQDRLEGIAFSPDGRLLATGSPAQSEKHLVRIWDVASGRELRCFAGHSQWVPFVAFSPDGHILVSSSADQTVRLWEVATGRERSRIDSNESMITWVAFSPDGRFLAWGGTDRLVHVHSLAQDKEVKQFAGHDGWITSLVYSADGKRLFSASYDMSALVWDVSRLTGGQAEVKRLTADEAASLWRELHGDDAAKAYRAMWRLCASPKEVMPLLREGLKPDTTFDAARLRKMIADLDDDEFAVREKATKELEQAGETAEPALCKTLEGKPSAEVKRRVESLLERLRRAGGSPERIRQTRELELLEKIDTPEGRELLERLIQGTPDAWLTKEAKAAKKRLAK